MVRICLIVSDIITSGYLLYMYFTRPVAIPRNRVPLGGDVAKRHGGGRTEVGDRGGQPLRSCAAAAGRLNKALLGRDEWVTELGRTLRVSACCL